MRSGAGPAGVPARAALESPPRFAGDATRRAPRERRAARASAAALLRVVADELLDGVDALLDVVVDHAAQRASPGRSSRSPPPPRPRRRPAAGARARRRRSASRRRCGAAARRPAPGWRRPLGAGRGVRGARGWRCWTGARATPVAPVRCCPTTLVALVDGPGGAVGRRVGVRARCRARRRPACWRSSSALAGRWRGSSASARSTASASCGETSGLSSSRRGGTSRCCLSASSVSDCAS